MIKHQTCKNDDDNNYIDDDLKKETNTNTSR